MNKAESLIQAILNKLTSGLPVVGGIVDVTVPPVNVTVEASKSVNDFVFLRSDDLSTPAYYQFTNGNTAKHYIMKLVSGTTASYFVGALSNVDADWSARTSKTYTNNILL